ncbi:hypothetical protein NLG97_g10493 [Lecanicillium saksenae]|uniref:Uncharacterized protein n=1 Tax=Lecanicillium saksenae TaxID=468837 RepID=A0ACC1QFS0_9HYPO|nr:hypothetical protein NLG97_g10493 [Lecanicillium saksenae]
MPLHRLPAVSRLVSDVFLLCPTEMIAACVTLPDGNPAPCHHHHKTSHLGRPPTQVSRPHSRRTLLLTIISSQTPSPKPTRTPEKSNRLRITSIYAFSGLPKKFDQKKILKVIKKKFACNGTIVADSEMGEVIQLQGDQRKDVQEFLVDKKEGLELDPKTIKVHGF